MNDVPFFFPTEIWINIFSQITDMNEIQSLLNKVPEFSSFTDSIITFIVFEPTANKANKHRKRISSSVYTIDAKESMDLVDFKDALDAILKQVRQNVFHRHLVLEFCHRDQNTLWSFQTVYRIIKEVFLNKAESPFLSVVTIWTTKCRTKCIKTKKLWLKNNWNEYLLKYAIK